MSTYHKNIIIILFLLLSVSCVRIDHIQDVLSDADSLRSVGKLYPDSSQLDSVVNVLKPVRYFYPDEYAAANYYYGRVLRDRNNQLEAMRCFINATHSNTTDYALLGRVYCNMGILCEMNDNYDLAVSNYEKSRANFLLSGDSIACLHALNGISIVLIKQNKKDDCLRLLREIRERTTDSLVLAISYLNQSILCKYNRQYDSSIWLANRAMVYLKNEPSCLLVKAQAFSYMNMKDSAIWYAKHVADNKFSTLQQKKNALYILQHDNADNISKDSINILASDRTDVLNALDKYHRNMAQAVQLLEQDLEHKPNYLLYILCSLAVCLTILFIFIRIRMLRIKKEKDSDIQKFNEDNQRLESNLNQMRQVVIDKIESTCTDLQGTDLSKTISWNDYEAMCSVINSSFNRLAEKLRAQYNLNEKEVRLCVLTLIDDKLSGSQMSNLLIYSEKSVRGLRSKTAKKLNTDGKQFRNKLLEIVLKTA